MTNFENAKVQVAQGWLQGYTEGKLKIFKGIPYAVLLTNSEISIFHRNYGTIKEKRG